MWEEHPAYQKLQARLIGLGIAALVVANIVFAVRQGDWELLRQILLISAAFVIALGLFFGIVWTLQKILTRKHAKDAEARDRHDES